MDFNAPPPGGDKRINWYPGHMARSKRLLAEQLSRVDVAVELCDARIPRASRNPDLDALLSGKPRLLVLGKSDLAEEAVTRAWLGYFRRQGLSCMAFDSQKGRAKDVLERVRGLSADAVARMAARGAKKTVRALIVGVPNVGKSTLTNKLNGVAVARTGDRPGVTRANQWVRVTPYLELLDTPGLLWPRLDDQDDARCLAFTGALADAATDAQELAIRLLEWLAEHKRDAVAARFHLKDASLRGPALLEEACRGRGWLLPGGLPDTDRGAAVVLDEFRAGKVGRVSLQRPPRAEAPEPAETPPKDTKEV